MISRSEHLSRTAKADETNPEWEPDAADFEALPWSNPAVWGKARDSGRIDEVIAWIVHRFACQS